MARADQVAELVRERVHGGRALVIDHRECVGGIGADADRQPAAHGIVDDEHGNVGAVLVAKVMDLVHVPVALVAEAVDMVEVAALLYVVGLIGVDELDVHVVDAAIVE